MNNITIRSATKNDMQALEDHLTSNSGEQDRRWLKNALKKYLKKPEKP